MSMAEGGRGGAATAAAVPPATGEDGLKSVGLLQAEQREVLRQRLAERQRELEAKKQRLTLLQHEQNATTAFAADAPQRAAAATSSGGADIGKSVASLMGEVMSSLKNLEKPAAAAQVETAAAAAKASTAAATLRGKGGGPAAAAAEGGVVSQLLGTTAGGTAALPTGKAAGLAFKLQRVPSEEAVIKPNVVTTFDKSVQADFPPLPGGGGGTGSSSAAAEEAEGGEEEDLQQAAAAAAGRLQQQQEQGGGETGEPKLVVTKDELLAATDGTAAGVLEGASGSSSEQKEAAKQSASQQGRAAAAAASPRPAALPEEERKRVMQTPEFEEFFDRTSKLVERLLGQEDLVEAFVEYPGFSASSEGATVAGEKLVLLSDYCWRKGEQRVILDLRCSPHFPGVFLAAYGGAPGAAAAADSEGCVLLWSLPMTQRPEYIFTSQSQVCGALFNRFEQSMIIGGTYAGNIVVWDCRAQSKPVQRSPMSSRAHAHPVYSLEMVGTKNSHNLVSVDTDGRLCVWSLQMLGAPTEMLDLKRGNKDICVESIAFQENEVNTVFLGTEDGALLQANIHRNKSGVLEAYEAHSGAITSVKFHPAASESGQWDYSNDLMLTTSVDWTIKLWRSRHTFSKPLHVFDNYDSYTYDTAWHPLNPALFAAVDGEGHIDLWNLAADWETAAYRVGGGAAADGLPPAAKTKVAWSSDGRRVVAGDAGGHVEVWNISNEFLQPRAEELDNFERRLAEAFPATAPGNMQMTHDLIHDLTD